MSAERKGSGKQDANTALFNLIHGPFTVEGVLTNKGLNYNIKSQSYNLPVLLTEIDFTKEDAEKVITHLKKSGLDKAGITIDLYPINQSSSAQEPRYFVRLSSVKLFTQSFLSLLSINQINQKWRAGQEAAALITSPTEIKDVKPTVRSKLLDSKVQPKAEQKYEKAENIKPETKQTEAELSALFGLIANPLPGLSASSHKSYQYLQDPSAKEPTLFMAAFLAEAEARDIADQLAVKTLDRGIVAKVQRSHQTDGGQKYLIVISGSEITPELCEFIKHKQGAIDVSEINKEFRYREKRLGKLAEILSSKDLEFVASETSDRFESKQTFEANEAPKKLQALQEQEHSKLPYFPKGSVSYGILPSAIENEHHLFLEVDRASLFSHEPNGSLGNYLDTSYFQDGELNVTRVLGLIKRNPTQLNEIIGERSSLPLQRAIAGLVWLQRLSEDKSSGKNSKEKIGKFLREIIDLLLRSESVTINTLDQEGASPLVLAALIGDKDIIQKLLAKGAVVAEAVLANAYKSPDIEGTITALLPVFNTDIFLGALDYLDQQLKEEKATGILRARHSAILQSLAKETANVVQAVCTPVPGYDGGNVRYVHVRETPATIWLTKFFDEETANQIVRNISSSPVAKKYALKVVKFRDIDKDQYTILISGSLVEKRFGSYMASLCEMPVPPAIDKCSKNLQGMTKGLSVMPDSNKLSRLKEALNIIISVKGSFFNPEKEIELAYRWDAASGCLRTFDFASIEQASDVQDEINEKLDKLEATASIRQHARGYYIEVAGRDINEGVFNSVKQYEGATPLVRDFRTPKTISKKKDHEATSGNHNLAATYRWLVAKLCIPLAASNAAITDKNEKLNYVWDEAGNFFRSIEFSDLSTVVRVKENLAYELAGSDIKFGIVAVGDGYAIKLTSKLLDEDFVNYVLGNKGSQLKQDPRQTLEDQTVSDDIYKLYYGYICIPVTADSLEKIRYEYDAVAKGIRSEYFIDIGQASKARAIIIKNLLSGAFKGVNTYLDFVAGKGYSIRIVGPYVDNRFAEYTQSRLRQEQRRDKKEEKATSQSVQAGARSDAIAANQKQSAAKNRKKIYECISIQASARHSQGRMTYKWDKERNSIVSVVRFDSLVSVSDVQVALMANLVAAGVPLNEVNIAIEAIHKAGIEAPDYIIKLTGPYFDQGFANYLETRPVEQDEALVLAEEESDEESDEETTESDQDFLFPHMHRLHYAGLANSLLSVAPSFGYQWDEKQRCVNIEFTTFAAAQNAAFALEQGREKVGSAIDERISITVKEINGKHCVQLTGLYMDKNFVEYLSKYTKAAASTYRNQETLETKASSPNTLKQPAEFETLLTIIHQFAGSKLCGYGTRLPSDPFELQVLLSGGGSKQLQLLQRLADIAGQLKIFMENRSSKPTEQSPSEKSRLVQEAKVIEDEVRTLIRALNNRTGTAINLERTRLEKIASNALAVWSAARLESPSVEMVTSVMSDLDRLIQQTVTLEARQKKLTKAELQKLGIVVEEVPLPLKESSGKREQQAAVIILSGALITPEFWDYAAARMPRADLPLPKSSGSVRKNKHQDQLEPAFRVLADVGAGTGGANNSVSSSSSVGMETLPTSPSMLASKDGSALPVSVQQSASSNPEKFKQGLFGGEPLRNPASAVKEKKQSGPSTTLAGGGDGVSTPPTRTVSSPSRVEHESRGDSPEPDDDGSLRGIMQWADPESESEPESEPEPKLQPSVSGLFGGHSSTSAVAERKKSKENAAVVPPRSELYDPVKDFNLIEQIGQIETPEPVEYKWDVKQKYIVLKFSNRATAYTLEDNLKKISGKNPGTIGEVTIETSKKRFGGDVHVIRLKGGILNEMFAKDATLSSRDHAAKRKEKSKGSPPGSSRK